MCGCWEESFFENRLRSTGTEGGLTRKLFNRKEERVLDRNGHWNGVCQSNGQVSHGWELYFSLSAPFHARSRQRERNVILRRRVSAFRLFVFHANLIIVAKATGQIGHGSSEASRRNNISIARRTLFFRSRGIFLFFKFKFIYFGFSAEYQIDKKNELTKVETRVVFFSKR